MHFHFPDRVPAGPVDVPGPPVWTSMHEALQTATIPMIVPAVAWNNGRVPPHNIAPSASGRCFWRGWGVRGSCFVLVINLHLQRRVQLRESGRQSLPFLRRRDGAALRSAPRCRRGGRGLCRLRLGFLLGLRSLLGDHGAVGLEQLPPPRVRYRVEPCVCPASSFDAGPSAGWANGRVQARQQLPELHVAPRADGGQPRLVGDRRVEGGPGLGLRQGGEGGARFQQGAGGFPGAVGCDARCSQQLLEGGAGAGGALLGGHLQLLHRLQVGVEQLLPLRRRHRLEAFVLPDALPGGRPTGLPCQRWRQVPHHLHVRPRLGAAVSPRIGWPGAAT
mmetsp:Transcript_2952/g.8653  ORF Transcript_2952/g.8653 Transcript_2952/m.8653 type:complete len:333 (-) Transcript_2952:2503-3501(-)